MKKLILGYLAMGLSAVSVQSKSPTTSFVRTTWSHAIVDGKATDQKVRRKVEHCTKDGEVWHEAHYRRDGSTERMYKTLRTDEHGNILEQVMYYDSYDAPQHLRFEYEDLGFYVVKREISQPDTAETSAILKFDDKDRLILQVWKNKYMTHWYTDTDKLKEFSTHYNNGHVTRSVYSYDAQDGLKVVERTDGRRPGKTTKVVVRGANGREKEMTRTNERGELLEKLSYTYAGAE